MKIYSLLLASHLFICAACQQAPDNKSPQAEKNPVSKADKKPEHQTNDTSKTTIPTNPDSAKYDEAVVGTFVADKSCRCPLKITISYKNGGYHYSIENGKIKKDGIAQIDESRGDTYIILKNIDGNKNIEAIAFGDYIAVQNYGNAMNNFNFFKNCDCKYLELSRQ